MKTGLPLLLAAAALAFALPAAAQQNVGSGGAIVSGTCDGADPDRVTTELLDFWEVRYRFGHERELGGQGLDVAGKLELMLTRLERLDGERAAQYRDWLDTFWDEAKDHEPRLPFPPLVDVGNITPSLPGGCHTRKVVEQLAPDSIMQTKRYLIRRDLFDPLDADNKAGLIMHELVYRDAIERGHKTSMKARLVTGMLASAAFEALTPEQYETFMIETGLIGYMAYITPGSSYGLKRYFDHKPLSLAGARDFCNRLRGDSRIANQSDFRFDPSDHYGVQFRASALGRRILGDGGDGRIRLWAGGPSAVLVTNAGQSAEQVDAETPLPFICWQETVASPWTAVN